MKGNNQDEGFKIRRKKARRQVIKKCTVQVGALRGQLGANGVRWGRNAQASLCCVRLSVEVLQLPSSQPSTPLTLELAPPVSDRWCHDRMMIGWSPEISSRTVDVGWLSDLFLLVYAQLGITPNDALPPTPYTPFPRRRTRNTVNMGETTSIA